MTGSSKRGCNPRDPAVSTTKRKPIIPPGSERDILIRSAISLFEPRRGTLVFSVTIIRSEWLTARGLLRADQIVPIRRWTQDKLRQLPASSQSFGIVEFALNVVANDVGRWSPHVHLLVRVPTPRGHSAEHRLSKAKDEFARLLKGATDFPQGVCRTLWVTLIDGPVRLEQWAVYVTKAADPASTYRRSRYQYRDESRVQKWTVKKLGLLGPQRREFDEAMVGVSLSDRLVLTGLRRPKGALQIIPVTNRPEPKSVASDTEDHDDQSPRHLKRARRRVKVNGTLQRRFRRRFP